MSNPNSGNSRGDGRDREEAVLAAVRDALRTIEFGSVLIKIHQGEVVGIETSTKVRLKNR
jgi:hypothetical protein